MDIAYNVLSYYRKKIELHSMGQDVEKKIYEKKKEMENGKLIYPRVELVVTTSCTLKCEGCSHMMPLYKTNRLLQADDLISTLELFLNLIDECICLNITGGEPLLYSELHKIIEFVNKQSKILFVEITTNGTILLKQDVLDKINRENTMVYISNYTCVDSVFELINLLEAKGITYLYEEESRWFDYGSYSCKDQRVSKLMLKYKTCMDGMYCTTLMNERLFCCSRAAFLDDLNLVDTKTDCIQLKEATRDDLLEFVNRAYMNICNYCDIDKHITISAGKQRYVNV